MLYISLNLYTYSFSFYKYLSPLFLLIFWNRIVQVFLSIFNPIFFSPKNLWHRYLFIIAYMHVFPAWSFIVEFIQNVQEVLSICMKWVCYESWTRLLGLTVFRSFRLLLNYFRVCCVDVYQIEAPYELVCHSLLHNLTQSDTQSLAVNDISILVPTKLLFRRKFYKIQNIFFIYGTFMNCYVSLFVNCFAAMGSSSLFCEKWGKHQLFILLC